jgi:TonB family protein
VLASDHEDSINSLSFSSAGDIVELVIFTQDEAFLQTLREAMGGARRLWHVLSADKVGDLLLAGQVGILVLDVQALSEPASAFVARIKLQFPELVVVVAGHREAEGSLANLISGGTVYRFIHKPVSPGRAKLFIDAAVRKYTEHHKPFSPKPPPSALLENKRLLWGAGITVLLTVAIGVLFMRQKAPPGPETREAAAPLVPGPLTGLSEAQERLLAHIESALLEDRLDDAAASIEAARKAGVDGNRVAYLTAQLAKSREQIKAAAAKAKSRGEPHATDSTSAQPSASPTAAQTASAASGQPRGSAAAEGAAINSVTGLLSLAAERIKQGRLVEPEADSAVRYVKQALQLDPDGNGAQAAKQTLSIALLVEVHAAIDHREFGRANNLLDAAEGIVAPANLESNRQLLAAAHSQADAAARDQLLKSALERLRQDRLVEPANDSAKYYLMTLRDVDPNNAGLATVTQELGLRLVYRARHALELGQFDAARGALDEAASLGYASAELSTTRGQIDAAQSQQQLLANVIDAKQLTLLKSVNPMYPQKATAASTQGWVELDFTVGVNGTVSDVAVHAASPPGIFDQAALAALAQWRYQPVLHDGKPTPQRARIRIRFALAG